MATSTQVVSRFSPSPGKHAERNYYFILLNGRSPKYINNILLFSCPVVLGEKRRRGTPSCAIIGSLQPYSDKSQKKMRQAYFYPAERPIASLDFSDQAVVS